MEAPLPPQVLAIPTAAGFVVSALRRTVRTFDDGQLDEPRWQARDAGPGE